MNAYKFIEGYVILDDKNIPQGLKEEIVHYNGLISTLEKSSSPQSHQLAIVNSEKKIGIFLQENPGIYAIQVTYGPIELIQSLLKKPLEVNMVISKLTQLQSRFGEEYVKKRLLFEPLELYTSYYDLGWSSGSLRALNIEGMQNNLFMLAVRSGNKELVEAILGLIPDDAFKKKLLLQCLQYRHMGNQPLSKPILKLAIESNSDELFEFLMNTLEQLGILKDAANEFVNRTWSRNRANNLLISAIEQANPAITSMVLKHKDKLGRILYFINSKEMNYPEYILDNFDFLPVLLVPIIRKNRTAFLEVFNHTKQAIGIDWKSKDFFDLQYKFTQLSSAISVIRLNKYLTHEDFDSVIFETILEQKIELHHALSNLTLIKNRFYAKKSIPMPESKEDSLNMLMTRMMLWKGSTNLPQNAKELLELPNILKQMYTQAMKVHNPKAAAIILLQLFQQNELIVLKEIINNADPMFKSIFLNYILVEGVRRQNSNLIQFATEYRLEIKANIFVELTKIPEIDLFLFTTKELFHHLHQQQLKYQMDDLKLVLSRLSSLGSQLEGHENSLELLLEELAKFNKGEKDFIFFGKSKESKEISQLMSKISEFIPDRNQQKY